MQIDINWIESRKEAIFQQQNIAMAWSSLDIVLAEITRLREALKAAEEFTDRVIRGWEYTLSSEAYRLPVEAARDCLIKIKTALGEEKG